MAQEPNAFVGLSAMVQGFSALGTLVYQQAKQHQRQLEVHTQMPSWRAWTHPHLKGIPHNISQLAAQVVFMNSFDEDDGEIRRCTNELKAISRRQAGPPVRNCGFE